MELQKERWTGSQVLGFRSPLVCSWESQCPSMGLCGKRVEIVLSKVPFGSRFPPSASRASETTSPFLQGFFSHCLCLCLEQNLFCQASDQCLTSPRAPLEAPGERKPCLSRLRAKSPSSHHHSAWRLVDIVVCALN